MKKNRVIRVASHIYKTNLEKAQDVIYANAYNQEIEDINNAINALRKSRKSNNYDKYAKFLIRSHA